MRYIYIYASKPNSLKKPTQNHIFVQDALKKPNFIPIIVLDVFCAFTEKENMHKKKGPLILM